MNKTYNWKRFWSPQGLHINLSDNGYLPDPESSFGKKVNPYILSFEVINHLPCLILLGEPGIGKSRTIKAEFKTLKEGADEFKYDVLEFDLRAYPSIERIIEGVFKNSKLSQWVNGNYPLYLFLDSLDEALIRVSDMADVLGEEIKHLPVERLYLRIACRSTEWPQSLSNTFRDIWGDDGTQFYTLTPLRRQDVALAAYTNELPVEEFLDALQEVEAVPLAIKPVTLNFLINKYKLDRKFPSRKIDLYREGIQLLCSETNQNRIDKKNIGRYTPYERLTVAAQVAAVMLLGNRYSIWTDLDRGDVAREDITIEQLVKAGISETLLRETLDTGLFSAKGLKRLGWAHQTYAEFLAAYYLNHQKMPVETIITMLSHADGKITPQLYETTAWLASMNPEIFRAIIRSDPQILLRSDIATVEIADREKLVGALLKLHDQKELFNLGYGIRKYLERLNHPEMSRQISPYLRDRNKNRYVRDFAIDLAEVSELSGVEDLLVELCLDPAEEPGIRVSAAHAIYRSGSLQVKGKLKPLLSNLIANDDPNDELKGYALLCLWPDHIIAQDLFKVLSHPKRENFMGGYTQFLRSEVIVDALQDEDLVFALRWISHQRISFSEISPIADVIDAIIIKSWNFLDSPEILFEFAQVILQLLSNHHELFRRGHDFSRTKQRQTTLDFYEDFKANFYRRRQIVLAIIPLLKRNEDVFSLTYSDPPLLIDDDLSWMIEQLDQTTSLENQEKWSLLIDRVFRSTIWSPERSEAIYRASRKNRILRKKLDVLFKPVRLNSRKATQMKKSFMERLEWQTEPSLPLLSPLPTERVLNLLDKFEKGDMSAWWILNREMTLEPTSTHYGDELILDLTKLPVWATTNEDIQSRIIKAAENYLIEVSPEPEKWLGENLFYRPAYAGYRALFLLGKLDNLNFIKQEPTLWQRWASIILAHHRNYEPEQEKLHEFLLQEAYPHIIGIMIPTLDRLINQENEESGYLPMLRRFKNCWDEKLLTYLFNKLRKDGHTILKSGSFNDLLEFLLVRTPKVIPYALFWIKLQDLSFDRNKMKLAASLLMQYTDHSVWDTVWSAIQEDITFGKEVVEYVAGAVDRHNNDIFSNLTESQLAELYIWLVKHYPHREDPDIDGVHVVSSREQVAQFRETLLRNLQARGTHSSLAAFEQIVMTFPELDYIKHMRIEATQLTRQRTWLPLSIEDILKPISGSRINASVNYDVFISHAWEDKQEIAELLAQGIKEAGFEVWYDNFIFRDISDESIRRSIDNGLLKSKHGIVILSHNYFKKNWTNLELDGLIELEIAGKLTITFVWHGITKEEILSYSPILTNRVALISDHFHVDELISELCRRLR